MTAALCQFPFAGFGCTPSPAGLFRIGAAALALREVRGSDIFLWEPSHGAHLLLGRLARRKGIRVIALIHNIKSLVPDQPCPIRPSVTNWLDIELALLANAEVIFCLSTWDLWLLRLRGLHVRLLPYYPARSRQQALCAIRAARLTAQIDGSIVVLGSAHNPPTRLGMIEQLKNHQPKFRPTAGNSIPFLWCRHRPDRGRPAAAQRPSSRLCRRRNLEAASGDRERCLVSSTADYGSVDTYR